MSTLSFQDYVRERMLRRRHEALHGTSAPAPLNERAALERGLPEQRFEPRAERLPEPPAPQPVNAPVARHNPLRPMHAALGAEQLTPRRTEAAPVDIRDM